MDQLNAKVQFVHFRVGRTGVLTPEVYVQPTEGDTSLIRVPLGNLSDLEQLELHLGDVVTIAKKATSDVPQITSVVVSEQNNCPVKILTKCPTCGCGLLRDGDNLRCINWECPDQLTKQLLRFASPDGMNIKGLGPRTCNYLVKTGKIKYIADIYELSVDDLEPAYGLKTAGELLDSIHESRNAVGLHNFIYALGIEGIGLASAKNIAETFHTFDPMLDRNLLMASPEMFKVVPGLTDQQISNLWNYLLDRNNLINMILHYIHFKPQ